MNYSTVQRFIEKNICAPLVYGHSINTIGQTDDWEPHIHEAHLQFTIRTMTCKNDYQKVKLNCMSFQTEILKRIFTPVGDFLKILQKCKQCRVGTLKIKFYCWTMWQHRTNTFFNSSKQFTFLIMALQKPKWIIFIKMTIYQGHTDLPSYFLC